MREEMPFRAGCFYDCEAIAEAFRSGPQAVSVRTVRRWLASSPALQAAAVRVGGRVWLPGAALVSWLSGSASARPAAPRDTERGVFVSARSEGELRRKVISLEVCNG